MADRGAGGGEIAPSLTDKRKNIAIQEIKIVKKYTVITIRRDHQIMVVVFEPPIKLHNAMTLSVLFSLPLLMLCGTRKYTSIKIKLERQTLPISIDGLF